MLISRVQHPVRSLGYGTRTVLWTQGCALACDGCVARDTWEPTAASEVAVDELLAWVGRHPDVDGVTISGGEPLDQPDHLVELLRGLRALLPEGADLLCFTGRTTGAVRSAFGEVLALLDAVVTGPFDRTRPSRHPLMGSANQEVLTLTDLGRQRYGDLPDVERRPVHVTRQGGRLWFVGIPNEGDLEAIEDAAARSGLEVGWASWKEGRRG